MSNKKKKEISWLFILYIVLLTAFAIAAGYFIIVYGVMGKGREPVPTLTPTATTMPTVEPTLTMIPTTEPAAPGATETPHPTATNTPTPTPEPAVTNTPVPTITNTPTPTVAPTDTPAPEPTATSTPTPTVTPTPTEVPHEHVWVEKEFPATCTVNGRTWDECECGEISNEIIREATGHADLIYVVVTEPTLDAEGTFEEICDVCGEVVNKGSIDKLAPTPTPTSTPTPTEVPAVTEIPLPTNVPTITVKPTEIPTAVPTATVTPTAQPPQSTVTPTPVPTEIPVVTATPVPTVTVNPTTAPVPTGAPTDVPKPTTTPVPTVTVTPTAVPTVTAAPKPTATPKPMATPTMPPTPTNTPIPPPTAKPVEGEIHISPSETVVTLTELKPLEYILTFTGNLIGPELEYHQSEELFSIRTNKSDSGRQYKIILMPTGNNGKTSVTLSLYAYNEYGERVKCDELILYIKVDIPDTSVYNPAEDGYPFLVEKWTHEGITVELWTKNEDSCVGVMIFSGEGIVTRDIKAEWTTYNNYFQWYVKKMFFGEGITEIYYGLPVEYLEEVSFPSTLKIVGDGAFENADLTEVILPEGVEEIEAMAFWHCDKLERIVLPSTLKSIGMIAFSHSTQSPANYENSLMELFIPKSVNFIDIGAFEYHYGLVITVEKGTDTSKYDKGWNNSGSSVPHKVIYE